MRDCFLVGTVPSRPPSNSWLRSCPAVQPVPVIRWGESTRRPGFRGSGRRLDAARWPVCGADPGRAGVPEACGWAGGWAGGVLGIARRRVCLAMIASYGRRSWLVLIQRSSSARAAPEVSASIAAGSATAILSASGVAGGGIRKGRAPPAAA